MRGRKITPIPLKIGQPPNPKYLSAEAALEANLYLLTKLIHAGHAQVNRPKPDEDSPRPEP